MTTETSNAREWVSLLERAVPFLYDEGAKYDDDGSNEPLELAREIETLLASLPSDESALSPASLAFDGGREAAPPPAAARGDVPYDRDLIARMLDVCGHPKFTLEAYMEQARLLREADNAAVANVGTVAARGDVRGLVAKLAAHVRPTCSELWDEAQAFLATEGVQAGEVEQRARELLAQEYERSGYTRAAERARHGEASYNREAIRAIVAALSQQPEARGVVDEDEVFRLAAGSHYGTEPNSYWDMDREALLAFARTIAQQPAAGALSRDELDTCRQWFDSVQDTNGGYLAPADYVLAAKLYQTVGMRVPDSIGRIATQHQEPPHDRRD